MGHGGGCHWHPEDSGEIFHVISSELRLEGYKWGNMTVFQIRENFFEMLKCLYYSRRGGLKNSKQISILERTLW